MAQLFLRRDVISLCCCLAVWPTWSWSSIRSRPHFGGSRFKTRSTFNSNDAVDELKSWRVTSAQEAKLKKGYSVTRTRREGESWVGEAVQDVKAPPGVVFSRITDFEQYPKMVMGCIEGLNYYVGPENAVGFQLIKTRLVTNVLNLHVDANFEHIVNPRQGTVTFTLDKTKK